MGMTKKHYEIVARSVAQTRKLHGTTPQAGDVLETLESILIEELGNENPRFVPAAFSRECRK